METSFLIAESSAIWINKGENHFNYFHFPASHTKCNKMAKLKFVLLRMRARNRESYEHAGEISWILNFVSTQGLVVL